jgi:competence protein ComEA
MVHYCFTRERSSDFNWKNFKEIEMKKLLLVILSVLAFSLSAFAAVDLNTASQAELEGVKGIGPKKAMAIIEYRKHTPFKTVEDLDNVKGFGKKSVDKIRADISVNGSKAAAPAKMEEKADMKAEKKDAKADMKAEKKDAKADMKAEKKDAKADMKAEKKADKK